MWQSGAPSRHKLITRRRLVGGLAGGGLSAMALNLAGCSDAGKPAATAASRAATAAAFSTARAGSTPAAAAANVDLNATLRAAISSDAGPLDPQAVGGPSNYGNTTTHFNSVMTTRPGQKSILPYMASYQWLDNNQTLQLSVKPGITFHNGEPFDANQLKFNLDRVLERTTYNPGFKSVYKGIYSGITGDVQVVDPMTVRMPAHDVGLIAAIGIIMLVVPMGYVTSAGDQAFAQKPVGTGPFSFVSHTADTELRSARFEKYFTPRDAPDGPRLPYAASLIQSVRPDDQSKIAALQAGEIDVAFSIAPDLVKQFEGVKGYTPLYVPAGGVRFIEFNTRLDKDPTTGGANPWKDLRVRKAANLAVDIKTLTQKLLTGHEQPAFGASSNGIGFPDDLKQKAFGYDPKQAKTVLTQAGYPDGFDTDFHIQSGGNLTEGPDLSLVVQSYLQAVGIRTTIKSHSVTEFDGIMRDNNVGGMFLFSGYNAVEQNPFIQATYPSTGFYCKSVTPELNIDQLFQQETTEFDPDRRNALLGQLWTAFYENASWLFLYETVQPGVMRSNIAWMPYSPPSTPAPEYWNMQVLKGA